MSPKFISSSLLILTLAISITAATCHTPPPPPPPVDPPTQFIVAVDLSTSMDSMARATHEKVLHALVDSLGFGDRLVLLTVHEKGVKSGAAMKSVAAPVLTGSKPTTGKKHALRLTRQTANLYVSTLFKGDPVVGSDILATLHTAANLAAGSASGSRTELLILSDMLHCAAPVCMDPPKAVPDSSWIEARKQQGLIRPLDHVCVSIVGADDSTLEGVRVRDFWRLYFQAAGADFSPTRYVHTAPPTGIARCS